MKMDDIEDDARYPRNSYAMSHRFNASLRQKHPIRSTAPYARSFPTRYEEDDDLDDYNVVSEHLGYEEEEYDEENNGHGRNFEEDNYFDRNPKKRKLRSSMISGYGFVPRVNLPHGVRNSSSEWTEHATFVLLEVWCDSFLQLGRKSLRSEDWHEVAEKVSEELKLKKTEAQCRSVLDKLKRRYLKEKAKVEEMGLGASKWAFFKKMDMLMASSHKQEYGLSCGVDSGEYVFMNTRVYLNRSNGFDEMRDSPGESEASDDENDSYGLPPRRKEFAGGNVDNGDGDEESSYRMLADSVQKFGKIHEKIEDTKRQQMMELEKLRLDFHRELELQKKQILEKAQAEIAKLQEQEEDGDDSDDSAQNLSE